MEQFERKIVKRHFTSDSETVWGLHSSVEIKDLGEVVKDMHEDLSYEMVLPKQTLITKERIKNLKFEKYQYPEEIERKIYHAICDENKDKLKEQIDKFKGYFKEHIIQPKQIRHMYLKMVSSIMNVVQEMDGTAYGKLQELSSFSYISNVRTSHELEQHLDEIAAILQSDEEKKEDIHNYTIKRAINYIREHYQEAITLDALADKLEITPEYLSTLFNREVEINFTTFLKRFRISHAKRLLKTTDLKVYEIAKMVGYADPKYFIRVFKEVQGASPKEFRLKK